MSLRLSWLLAFALIGVSPAFAQMGAGGPPAVGVVKAEQKPIIETNEFVGRIQAVNRVDLVARVTAFLDQQMFTEGAEVKKGQLMYVLERAPFEADVEAKQASVAQAQAQLQNATISLARAEQLLKSPAGNRSAYDDALAKQRSDAAQVMAAQAQLKQSQINLDYTEIKSPIDGKVGQTAVTVGNVVTPSSGALARIVSQDPEYVVFPISLRSALDLRDRYADKGGLKAVVIKLRLPNGKMYPHDGKLDFEDISVAQSTDTITLRGVVPNPVRTGMKPGEQGDRELTDGEFVTVLVQGIEPIEVLAIPRAAILTDQQGDYVYVVDAKNKVEQRRIHLGQSTPTTASVVSGLKESEVVIVDGLQRVRPGMTVQPGPASPPPTATDSSSPTHADSPHKSGG